MKRIMFLFLSLLLVLGLGRVAFAEGNPASKGITANPNPPSVSIWTDKSEYKVGDPVVISFKSDVDGNAAIYDITPDGKSTVIWPQQGANGSISAGRIYTLPSCSASEPTGTEKLTLVVTKSKASTSFSILDLFLQGLANQQQAPADEKISASCTFNVIPNVPRTTLRISGGAGARIFIDGREYGTAPLTTQLDAGRHHLVALMPGMLVITKQVTPKESQTGLINWQLNFKPIK